MGTLPPSEYEDLPGSELVAPGLADLRSGRETVASLLVGIGAPRLAWLGVLPPDLEVPGDPEAALFLLLEVEDPRTAHAGYNALVRRLVRFERALEQRIFRDRRASAAAPGVALGRGVP